MTKLFYDHLIRIEEVIVEFDNFELNEDERNEFLSLIDETINNQIINTILNNLPTEHHERFLSLFHQSPHRKEVLIYIKEKSPVDIEKEIEKQAEKIKREILQEIKRSKRKR